VTRPLAQLLEEWEPVIGREVHVQLATKSKAFSPSATTFGEPPNTLTDPLVLGMPGTLPVFNRAALELALRLGVATSSQIRAKSRFARKHYFYPDLPKGYQISQYDEPLCEHGHPISSSPATSNACGSRASTSRRMPARTRTSARSRMSISTARACRSSRWCRRRS
jgi:aspartyl-tRNA(Asn)/glutamyl-tRNA(Gln) amidotransferase subunit B